MLVAFFCTVPYPKGLSTAAIVECIPIQGRVQ